MKKIKTVLAGFSILLAMASSAQVNIFYPNSFKKVMEKGGTTYVVMKNPNAPKVAPYKQVIKDYWKITPVEIIATADIDKYSSKDGAFLFLETITPNLLDKESAYAKKYSYNLTLFAGKNLSLTTLTTDALNFVANIGLCATKQGAENLVSAKATQRVSVFNFDGEKNLWSWGAGVFKNYILTIQNAVKNGDVISTKRIVNKTALATLKTRPLIVPDYEGLVSSKADKIFKDYPYKYKIVSIDSANSKILSSEKPFYYLLFFVSSTAQKQVTIWNSQTGEIVYLDNSIMARTSLFNAKDMKNIQAAIEK